MKANPDTYQAISLGRKSRDSRPVFEIRNVQIAAEDHVKLLGVDIDVSLSLNTHLGTISITASLQINV
jgi:hypothetical protein